jgi:hypothetical protein
MNKTKFQEEIEPIVDELLTMLEKRNIRYGDKNLLDSGYYGIVIRIKDKLARIIYALRSIEEQKLVTNEENSEYYQVINEALQDIAGYAINALRLNEEMPTGVNDLWK